VLDPVLLISTLEEAFLLDEQAVAPNIKNKKKYVHTDFMLMFAHPIQFRKVKIQKYSENKADTFM